MKNTIKDLLVKHEYYCNDTNYHDSDCRMVFNNWKSFYKEFGDADVNWNLLFRWDIEESLNSYSMKIFFIQQRKGVFLPVVIVNIYDEDADQIIEFLSKHFNHIKSLWSPIEKFEVQDRYSRIYERYENLKFNINKFIDEAAKCLKSGDIDGAIKIMDKFKRV